MSEITVGADPEVFIKDGDTIISAIGLIGGSKEFPLIVDNGALQEDNVLAEFNIDPVTDEDSFVHNIKSVMKQLEDLVYPYSLDFSQSHTFEYDYLKGAGLEAFKFGCDPDYHSWEYCRNPTVNPDDHGTLRGAGGHIHVGFDYEGREDQYIMACLLDLFCTIPSILVEDVGQGRKRRCMYGKAGACRPKEYGVESRSISNVWVSDESYMRKVFRGVMMAHDNMDNFKDIFDTETAWSIQDTINYSDKEQAEELCIKLGIPLW